jgi:hypothetical protein
MISSVVIASLMTTVVGVVRVIAAPSTTRRGSVGIFFDPEVYFSIPTPLSECFFSGDAAML